MKNKKETIEDSISVWSKGQIEALIYLTVTNGEFGKQFLNALEASEMDFTNAIPSEPAYRFIWNVIREEYKKNNRTPKPDEILFAISATGDEEKCAVFKANFVELMKHNYEPALLEKVKEDREQWIRMHLTLRTANKALEMLRNEESGTLEWLINESVKVDRLTDFSHTMAEKVDEGSLFNDLVSNRIEIVPTNSTFLNDMLGGGIRKKEICVFGMSSGSGKSCVSSGMAPYVACKGYNVVHFVLEDTDTSTKAKYASMVLGIEASLIEENPKQYADLFDSERFKNYEKKLNEHLRTFYASSSKYMDFQTAEYTVEKIDKSLEKLKYEGFTADLLIIDYYDRLSYKTTNKLQEGNESYLAGKIMTQLDILAKKWNVALFIPSQLTKEGDTLPIEQLSGLYISGGKKKKDFCQSMFIMRNSITGDYNDKDILICKNRHKGNVGDIYTLRFDNRTCLFDNKTGYAKKADLSALDETDSYQMEMAKSLIEK